MDNCSRRLSSEDTATSMYLSFDAESTMSTACYKTMEAMSDISTMSSLSIAEGMEELVNMNKSDDKHLNSTLEAQNDSSVISPIKTVKKLEPVTNNSPLRALPKNILKGYKALCSTPSKEQILKTVNVTRGSDATRCIDLGLAFLGVDDENPAYFPPPPTEQFEENKENALPESEEGSTLSVSSSVEIATSVIERKMLSSMSTVESITEESIEEMELVEKLEDMFAVKEGAETTPKAYNENILKDATKINEKFNDPMGENETGFKVNYDFPGEKDAKTEFLKKSDDLTPKVKEIILTKSKMTGKPKIAILSSRNTRRSICEPNLQTNRPSRIQNSGRKRQSLLPTSRAANTQMDAETEIPILLNKMLKISNNTSSMQLHEDIKKEVPMIEQKKFAAPNEKRRSIITSMKTRTSLIPSASGEKRPFSFTQRMSVVVKTTLNSPARKIARKSTLGTTMTSTQRRSMMPTKTKTDACSKIPNNLLVTRKSMLPKTGVPFNTKTTIKSLTSVKECPVTSNTETKSIYSMPKDIEGSKIKPPCGISYHKPDTSFTCNVCKEKFRIKSLLDAHKRSHESDNTTPAFIKKPIGAASSASSLSGNTNQCKYCDKKFALVRALHIHLLQNCSKIPPADKRKLQYTDLNHVEKAQLPNVFSHNHQPSTVTSSSATPVNVFKHNRNAAPKSSSESLNDNNDAKSPMDDGTIDVSKKMAPPQNSVQKMKKNTTAHAGVYRTPSKTVPCHLCKLTFKSILDYTNHSLTAHGSKTIHNSDKDNEVQQLQ